MNSAKGHKQISDIEVCVFCLAYNHEKYIRKTLEGFVMQKTNFRYEVLVHDDASTDHTVEIINEFAMRYPDIIKPILQKENQYSKKIDIFSEILLPLGKGKYIALCEGDDYWNDENKLQKQYDVLEKHQECSMSTHKVQCCNEDGTWNERLIPETSYKINEECVLEEQEIIQCLWIRGGYPFHTSSYFMRRKVLEIDFKFWRDIGMLRKALICGKIYYFDTPMSTRRLWSVGNWNSRLKAKGAQGQINLVISDIEIDKRFDVFTEYRYHDAIVCGQAIRALGLAEVDISIVRKILIDNQIKLSDICKNTPFKIGMTQRIKYILVVYFPIILQLWYNLKNK